MPSGISKTEVPDRNLSVEIRRPKEKFQYRIHHPTEQRANVALGFFEAAHSWIDSGEASRC
jgi:hypothetical protein